MRNISHKYRIWLIFSSPQWMYESVLLETNLQYQISCMRKQSPIFFTYCHKFFEIRLLFVIQRFFRAGFLKKAMSYLTCCPYDAACLWMCVSLGVVNTDFFQSSKDNINRKKPIFGRGDKKKEKCVFLVDPFFSAVRIAKGHF